MIEALVDLGAGRRIGPVRRRTFGSFVEHLGRAVYGGIYEPGHPTADSAGFRGDVIDLVRELGVSTVRYPGGNFVSGYRWEDGIGPRRNRPRRLDLAWQSVETNEIGVDEFVAWCRLAGCEPMMAVNLGTRGPAEALDLLEYCNHPAGTHWSDRRVANGAPAPHDVRMWCLGNEMDGPWQLGHRSAEEYGALAARTAAAMRMYDPTLELVVCGSSGSSMPTFGAWEREVLEHCYDNVSHISCHAYYEPLDGDLASFLASAVDMERFIDAVLATADHVGASRRSSKRIEISFDEWNVWYLSQEPKREPGDWAQAPRLLENIYSAADAVVVGSLLIALLRRSDRVTSASLAQLVNVIAPIMTAPGGPAWRQTTFHPFALTSRLARGTVVVPAIEAPTTPTAQFGAVAIIDAVATLSGDSTSVFLVNRSLTEEARVLVRGEQVGTAAGHTLADADPTATSTVPVANATVEAQPGGVAVTLPPVSWTVLTTTP